MSYAAQIQKDSSDPITFNVSSDWLDLTTVTGATAAVTLSGYTSTWPLSIVSATTTTLVLVYPNNPSGVTRAGNAAVKIDLVTPGGTHRCVAAVLPVIG